MVRKYTFEQVKQTIEQNGWQLLSLEYVNCKIPLDVVCPNGHQSQRTFDQIQVKPQGCVICGTARSAAAKIKTQDKAAAIAKNLGFILLGQYVSATSKVEIRCESGHTFRKSLTKLQTTPICPECFKAKYRTRTEYDAQQIFASHGFTMTGTFSDVIEGKITTKEKVEAICPEGHLTSINLNNFLQGKRCKQCANAYTGKLKQSPDDELRAMVESEGYSLRAIERRHCTQTEISVTCTEGHQYSVGATAFRQGARCATCHRANCRGVNHPQWRHDLSDAERLLGKRRMNLAEYKKWRSDAHELHGSKCKCCGSNEKLHAHHIHNWADHPELRFDPNNAAILCDFCHKKFHRTYGQRNTNKAQLDAFLMCHSLPIFSQ